MITKRDNKKQLKKLQNLFGCVVSYYVYLEFQLDKAIENPFEKLFEWLYVMRVEGTEYTKRLCSNYIWLIMYIMLMNENQAEMRSVS